MVVVGVKTTLAGDTRHEEASRWDLLEECRLDPDRPATSRGGRKSDQRMSTTDPDAVLMKPRGAQACLGYQDHYVVDGGKARIILHALVTPGDVMENQPMLDVLRRVMFRWRLRPQRVIADTTYATIENIRALEGEEDIRAYMPLPDWEHQRDYYGPGQFSYDTPQDVYACPEGGAAAPVSPGMESGEDGVPSGSGDLQCLSREGGMYPERSGAASTSLIPRGVSRPGTRPP